MSRFFIACLNVIMTIAFHPVSSNLALQPYVPAGGQVSAAAALSSEAVSLSEQSAVVSLLGGASAAPVYTASGLLNSLQQAGTQEEPVSVPAPGGEADAATIAQQALEQGIVATLPATSLASGLYTSNGAASAASLDMELISGLHVTAW